MMRPAGEETQQPNHEVTNDGIDVHHRAAGIARVARRLDDAIDPAVRSMKR
jgi:hypothetical protein